MSKHYICVDFFTKKKYLNRKKNCKVFLQKRTFLKKLQCFFLQKKNTSEREKIYNVIV